MKVKLLIFFLTLSIISYSQSSTSGIPIEYKIRQIDDQRIEMQFYSDALIHNLLVVVADKDGQTVYLDCRQEFKGTYTQLIDFNKSVKGNYSFQVIRDEEVYVKTLNIK